MLKNNLSKRSRKWKKKGTKTGWDKWKTNSNMGNFNPTILIIILNVNDWKVPTKRQRLSHCIKTTYVLPKKKPTLKIKMQIKK